MQSTLGRIYHHIPIGILLNMPGLYEKVCLYIFFIFHEVHKSKCVRMLSYRVMYYCVLYKVLYSFITLIMSGTFKKYHYGYASLNIFIFNNNYVTYIYVCIHCHLCCIFFINKYYNILDLFLYYQILSRMKHF